MGIGRVLLCLLLPPLAVLDKGCGSIVLVTILTLCGWVPGALAALIVCSRAEKTLVVVKEGKRSEMQERKNEEGERCDAEEH
jgi:uncharacterized membrane protein YqaE (UPF0057 family)